MKDDFNNSLFEQFDFNKSYIGIVLDNSEFESDYKVKVYIPELFGEILTERTTYNNFQEKISTTKLQKYSELILSDTVTITNYLDCKPMINNNITIKNDFYNLYKPKKGDVIKVSFFNGNPLVPYYENSRILKKNEILELLNSPIESNIIENEYLSSDISLQTGDLLISRTNVDYDMEKNSYTLTLVENGNFQKEKLIPFPTPPEREGYIFSKWNPDITKVSNELFNSMKLAGTLENGITFTPVYIKKQFTVNFYNETNKLIKSVLINYKESAVSQAPSITSTVNKTFYGWDKDLSEITENITVRPVYNNPIYKVTFKNNVNSEKILVCMVQKGTKLTYPVPPIINNYEFKVWDKNLTLVNSDTVITALYDENTLPILIKDIDGKIIKKYKNDTLIADFNGNGLEDTKTTVESATNLNVPDTLVKRDNNGKFLVTSIEGNLIGLASTASKLNLPRNISLINDVTGNVNFDGSSNVSIISTLSNTGVTAGTYTKVNVDAKGRIITGNTLSASDIPMITLNKISDVGTVANKNVGIEPGMIPILDYNGKLDYNILPSIAITDTHVINSEFEMLNLVAQVGDVAIRRDLNKSFILKTTDPGYLDHWSELLTPTDVVTSVAGKVGNITLVKGDVGLNNVDNTSDSNKNVLSASKLTTSRNISLINDVTGNIDFDGSSNISIISTLSNTGVTAGTYTKVNVDAKGRILTGSNPTTLSGFGILDAVPLTHVGSKGDSHDIATTTINGFMSYTDKVKLDGLINYVHPNTHSALIIEETNDRKFVSQIQIDDWSNKPHKKVFNIGDGILTDIVLQHDMGTRDLVVSVRRNDSPYEFILTDIQFTTDNTLTLFFLDPPLTNEFRVTIIG